MSLWKLAEEFAEACRRCEDVEALRTLLDDASGALGFRYFALVHSLSFRRSAAQLIKIDTYPTYWSERFVRQRLYLNDPVLHVSQYAGRGFAWHELPGYLSFDRRHNAIMAVAARQGLGDGFTLPVRIPGEPNGSCSFALRTGQILPFRRLQCAGIIGGFAFEAARRLVGYRIDRCPIPHLSPRQFDCVRMLVLGRSDKEIARALDLSPETVRDYVKTTRALFEVANRTQLAVEAIRLGIIGYDDAIPSIG